MAKARTGKGRRVMRHRRVRTKVAGTPVRPRLAVFRSLNHVYAQIVDDTQGITLAAASSLDPDVRRQKDGKAKTDVSKLVGELIARRAKEKGVSSVVFDRGWYKFHGRVKSLAGAAREGGLVF